MKNELTAIKGKDIKIYQDQYNSILNHLDELSEKTNKVISFKHGEISLKIEPHNFSIITTNGVSGALNYKKDGVVKTGTPYIHADLNNSLSYEQRIENNRNYIIENWPYFEKEINKQINDKSINLYQCRIKEAGRIITYTDFSAGTKSELYTRIAHYFESNRYMSSILYTIEDPVISSEFYKWREANFNNLYSPRSNFGIVTPENDKYFTKISAEMLKTSSTAGEK